MIFAVEQKGEPMDLIDRQAAIEKKINEGEEGEQE